MKQLTAQRSSRVLWVLGAAILFLAAVPAKTANLVDVRVGLHENYTRVVLETDAKASCEIESSGSEELVLRLGASSGTRIVPSAKSAHLMSVAVKPMQAGESEIRIALRVPVDVKKIVLTEPPRVVLDLREAKQAGAMAPAAEPPAPEPREPEPAVEAPPEPKDAASPRAAEPGAPTELGSETAPEEPAKPVAELAEPSKKEETAAAPSLPEPDPGAVLPSGEAPSRPAPPARRPSTPPSRAVVPPPAAAQGGLLDALPAPLDEPLVLAALAVIVLLVIVFLILRRRGAAAEQEPITPFAAGEPFSVDEQAEAAEAPEVAEADADLPARPGEAVESSLFDEPVEMAEPGVRPGGAAPGMDRDEVGAAVPAGGPAAGTDASREIERRLAKLEERLEEIADEKERLGRQVAAQTEELRVQRAAIARTQRVLRDLTRPADEPTEPAPKT